jgi:hypothetical protein
VVEKDFDFDPLVDPTGITVKTMNGDVALIGAVRRSSFAITACRRRGPRKPWSTPLHLTMERPYFAVLAANPPLRKGGFNADTHVFDGTLTTR